MLAALLTLLAPVFVAFRALRHLRAKRLRLRALRDRFRDTLQACERLLDRFEVMEPAARVAGLAPSRPGCKPGALEPEFVGLRESLRQVEGSLQEAEAEWQLGRTDLFGSRLVNLHHQIELVRDSSERLASELHGHGQEVPPEAAREALAARAQEELEALAPHEAEIRLRIEREVARLLERARGLARRSGPWVLGRLELAGTAAGEAAAALERGDLVVADRSSRRARALAGSLVRLCDLGLAPVCPPERAGPWPALAAACEEARIPAPAGLAWTLALMALAAWLGNLAGGLLSGGSTRVLTTSGNIALGAPTAASHALDQAHLAVDGDVRSAWMSGVSLSEPQALVIDLRGELAVGKVLVLPVAAPKGMCRWEIDLSPDSSRWRKVGAGASTCGWMKSKWGTTEATGTAARFVRIRPLDWGRSGVAIAEVRVFAPSTSDLERARK